MKWTKCAIRFLRISRPGVRVPSIAPRKTSTHCVLVFLFCLRDGRGSNRAAAHSAASNQPSGLLLRVTGCGSQHPPRALGGTCVLLAAAPTTPPCIGHRPQSSLLQVPMVRNVYRGSCGSKDFMAFLFCKPWVHGFCTVFARSVFSMSDDVGRCIALQSVPFFASGEQG